METTKIETFGEIILTQGMTDAATGQRIYGVFASEADARSMDADARSLGTLGEADLTAEQRELAARNSAALAE